MGFAKYLIIGIFIIYLYFGQTTCDSSPKIITTKCENLSRNPLIVEMINSINETEVYNIIEILQKLPSRKYGTTGNIYASSLIYNKLSNISRLRVEHQSKFNNIIATLPGANNLTYETVIVGAHYDSISYDQANSSANSSAPGATDDACGVAIVLEMARVMCRYQFNHSIIFAFWNLEEEGRQGSSAYVEDLSNNSKIIPFYINFDSPCYDPEGRFILDIMYKDQPYWGFTQSTINATQHAITIMNKSNTLYGLDFNLTYNVHPCGSDYKSFWSHGYSAVMTHSQTHGPAHTQFDTINNVSLNYSLKNGQLGIALIAQIAEVKGLGSEIECYS
jgi:Zn-dependent M28 family amino/carboxypeptidase